ncbi:hypothetical protein MHBO_003222, partial [Bonamia ostreae]
MKFAIKMALANKKNVDLIQEINRLRKEKNKGELEIVIATTPMALLGVFDSKNDRIFLSNRLGILTASSTIYHELIHAYDHENGGDISLMKNRVCTEIRAYSISEAYFGIFNRKKKRVGKMAARTLDSVYKNLETDGNKDENLLEMKKLILRSMKNCYKNKN